MVYSAWCRTCAGSPAAPSPASGAILFPLGSPFFVEIDVLLESTDALIGALLAWLRVRWAIWYATAARLFRSGMRTVPRWVSISGVHDLAQEQSRCPRDRGEQRNLDRLNGYASSSD
jgi:hypothetical protein